MKRLPLTSNVCFLRVQISTFHLQRLDAQPVKSCFDPAHQPQWQNCQRILPRHEKFATEGYVPVVPFDNFALWQGGEVAIHRSLKLFFIARNRSMNLRQGFIQLEGWVEREGIAKNECFCNVSVTL